MNLTREERGSIAPFPNGGVANRRCSCRFTEQRWNNMTWRNLALGMTLSTLFPVLPQQAIASGLTHRTPVAAEAAVDTKILEEFEQMIKFHQTYLSVPLEDGRALRLLTEPVDARRGVEIGTLTG